VTDDAGRVSPVATQTISVGENRPTATFTFSPTTPFTGQPVIFNASQSRAAPGRTIASYGWDFGDGAIGSGVQQTHAYAQPGTYAVTLTVTDNAGQTAFFSQNVPVASDQPTAKFTVNPPAPVDPAPPPPNTTGADVTFDGSTSTVVSGRTITSYVWQITRLTSPGGVVVPSPASGAIVSANLTSGSYSVTLTITDSAGRTASTTATVTVTNGS